MAGAPTNIVCEPLLGGDASEPAQPCKGRLHCDPPYSGSTGHRKTEGVSVLQCVMSISPVAVSSLVHIPVTAMRWKRGLYKATWDPGTAVVLSLSV